MLVHTRNLTLQVQSWHNYYIGMQSKLHPNSNGPNCKFTFFSLGAWNQSPFLPDNRNACHLNLFGLIEAKWRQSEQRPPHSFEKSSGRRRPSYQFAPTVQSFRASAGPSNSYPAPSATVRSDVRRRIPAPVEKNRQRGCLGYSSLWLKRRSELSLVATNLSLK